MNQLKLDWALFKARISPDALDPREEQTGESRRFSYRLVEDNVNALYGYVIVTSGHLKVAIYFDNEFDIDLTRTMFASITDY